MKKAFRKAYHHGYKLTTQERIYLFNARVNYLLCRMEYEEAITYFLILKHQPE